MFTSEFPGYTCFHRLSDPLANRPLRLSPTDDAVELIPDNEAYPLARGLWQPPRALVLRASMGGQATDFLWSTYTPIVCVSERVLRLLENEEFVGWGTYPVEVYDRKGSPLPGYWGFAVLGPNLEHDRSMSAVLTKPPPTLRGHEYQVYKGLYFRADGWDGSDFFLVEGFTVVTERVRKEFKRHRITNVRLTSLVEVEVDVLLDRFG